MGGGVLDNAVILRCSVTTHRWKKPRHREDRLSVGH